MTTKFYNSLKANLHGAIGGNNLQDLHVDFVSLTQLTKIGVIFACVHTMQYQLFATSCYLQIVSCK